MQKKLLAAPALTALVALPIAGYATFYLMEDSPLRFGGELVTDGPVVRQDATSAEPAKEKKADQESDGRDALTWAEINNKSDAIDLLRKAGATRP